MTNEEAATMKALNRRVYELTAELALRDGVAESHHQYSLSMGKTVKELDEEIRNLKVERDYARVEVAKAREELREMEARAIAATFLIPDSVMIGDLRTLRDRALALL